MKKPELSVIILSYNTNQVLKKCLDSLKRVRKELSFEVIVADNGSTDGSLDMVKKDFPWVVRLDNKKNIGFARGNNNARRICQGKYILFLNSDTIVYKNSLSSTLEFLKMHPEAGAVTCKLVLANGELDKDARRSFPTPWVSFTHLILHIDKIFPRSPVFSRYWYGHIHEDTVHEVDVIQGAFFLSPKKVLDEVGWFSEDYFLNGEDIDLCWKIVSTGHKIYYYPKTYITHLKGTSKGQGKVKKKVPFKHRLKFRMAGVDSMEIFYRKFMWKKYPILLNLLVLIGLRFLKIIRFLGLVFK